MGQFSNSFPKHFSYLCEYTIRFALSCSFCEYSFIFHCLHCSPSCFDPDSLLLAYLWLGLSWIGCISANQTFYSSRTNSRKPYTSSKQQERHKHSVEITINVSLHALWGLRAAGVVGGRPRGGWPATVVRGVWCQAPSLPRPPVLWGGQPGYRDPCVPGAVGVGVGTQHRFHSVRPCGPALLAVGVAEGRPRGGCLPPL